MSEAVMVALVSGGLTLIGVMMANNRTQAVTSTKLEELTREVRAHNDFARRVPLLEQQMADMKQDVRELQTLRQK